MGVSGMLYVGDRALEYRLPTLFAQGEKNRRPKNDILLQKGGQNMPLSAFMTVNAPAAQPGRESPDFVDAKPLGACYT